MLNLKQNATPMVDVPDEVVDGLPEFAFTSSDPAVKERLRALAKTIVASHKTNNRIAGFEVHGHADVARVPEGPQREQTELEVSRDRAENARQMLLCSWPGFYSTETTSRTTLEEAHNGG